MARIPGIGDIVGAVGRRVPIGPLRRHRDTVLPFVPRSPSVQPILPVSDMAEAVTFYEQLGFDVEAYDPGYAWIRHCGWEFLHLALAAGMDPAANEAAAYVHVADADAWYTAMAAAAPNADIGEIADMPWGMREYSFTDPGGNRVRIGQHI